MAILRTVEARHATRDKHASTTSASPSRLGYPVPNHLSVDRMDVERDSSVSHLSVSLSSVIQQIAVPLQEAPMTLMVQHVQPTASAFSVSVKQLIRALILTTARDQARAAARAMPVSATSVFLSMVAPSPHQSGSVLQHVKPGQYASAPHAPRSSHLARAQTTAGLVTSAWAMLARQFNPLQTADPTACQDRPVLAVLVSLFRAVIPATLAALWKRLASVVSASRFSLLKNATHAVQLVPCV